MPELPEVETMCRGIAGVRGATIVASERLRCRLKPIAVHPAPARLAKCIVGKQIETIERLGKRVVLRLTGDDRLIIEPRMTGLVLVTDPPNTTHLRYRWRLADARVNELLFWDRRGLGTVRWYAARDFAQAFANGKLGPDALAISCDELRRRLTASRRAIKVALLDQRALAGVGNLYASEILHAAKVNPAMACCELSPAAWRKIHRAMGEILAKAILYEGSTLSDGTYRNALNQSGGYQNEHRVYDKAGEACRRCKRGTIVRIVQAQRSTFYCPECQK